MMKRGNLPIAGYWDECFKIADKNENGTLSLKEANGALRKHNVNIKKSDLVECFHLVAEPQGCDEISKEGFARLYEMLNPFPMQTQLYEKFASQWVLETMQDRKDSLLDGGSTIESKSKTFRAVSSVTKVFPNLSEYSAHLWNTSYMVESEFERFLIEDGKVPCPDVEQVMRRYSQTSNKSGTLSFSGFLHFLFSEKCGIMKRIEKKVNMDMAYPLNHYYVNSSHNTYLEGNQLTSSCSVEAYLRALRLGTRLLELDVHPGPKGSEPVIKHLNFPTNPVSFREVCEAINEHAFKYSSYPLILSIEDHCEADSNAKNLMNEIIVEVFGNLLFTDDKLQNNQLLPSPQELKGYVIIKNKRLRQELFINVCRGVTAKNLGEVFVPGDKNPRKCQPNFVTSIAKSKFYSLCSSKSLEDSEFAKRCKSKDKLRKEEIGETCSEALVEWTKRSQLRVYPANTQVLSGHFDPRDAWMCGVQYASLNLQTVDLYFIFNLAMFARNGGCGYVLKPCYLRPRNGTFFNPLTLETRNKETQVREILKKRYLNVHILGGAHLPRKCVNGKFSGDMVDVYVKVSLYDKIGKSKCQSFRTRTIKDNGFNPVWNEKANFIVDCPDLAFCLIEVYDKDLDSDELVGIYCIHFQSIQNGYVTVPLYDENYQLLPYASLFVRIHISM